MRADIVATYIIGVLIAAMIGTIWAYVGAVDKREKRIAARIALLSPVWPALLAVGVWVGVGRLWVWANDRG